MGLFSRIEKALISELRGGTPEALQRGKSMGFDIDKPMHHASHGRVTELKPGVGELGLHIGTEGAAKGADRLGTRQVQQIVTRGEFAKAPDLGNWDAYSYYQARNGGFSGPNGAKAADEFDPRYERMWKRLDEAATEHINGSGRSFKDWRAVVQAEANRNGLSGWEYTNWAEDPGSVSRIIMQPNAARELDAVFDPAQEGSSKLLASLLPVGVALGAGGLLSRWRQEQA